MTSKDDDQTTKRFTGAFHLILKNESNWLKIIRLN